MSGTAIRQTSFLVLRRTPYSEASLVVAGLTPGHGQMHFLVRGARRTGRKQFPIVDLFRLLAVHYRPGRGDLTTWRSAELLSDFGGLARNHRAMAVAGWLAQFVLANAQLADPAPRLFRATAAALGRLASCAGTTDRSQVDTVGRAAVVGCCLVFLDEHGLLPAYSDDPARAQRVRDLLAFGEGSRDQPEWGRHAWELLQQWAVALLEYTDCRVPAGLP